MPAEEMSPAHQDHAENQHREHQQANGFRAQHASPRRLRLGIAFRQAIIVSRPPYIPMACSHRGVN